MPKPVPLPLRLLRSCAGHAPHARCAETARGPEVRLRLPLRDQSALRGRRQMGLGLGICLIMA